MCGVAKQDDARFACGCRGRLDELSEFVYVSLTRNKHLRHQARDKFGYTDPGKPNPVSGEVGSVAAFESWLREFNDAEATSNFVRLAKFLYKKMTWVTGRKST